MRSARLLPSLALATALALAMTACGGDDGDAASTTTAPASSSDDSTTTTAADGGATVPDDVCALVTAEAVAAITGEAGVTANDVPGGGCQYKDESARGLYPTVTIQSAADFAGGIEGAQTGAEGTTGGTATPITVGDATGYVVSGDAAGASATQAAVDADGTIVILTLAGSDFAHNEDVAPAILQLFVDAL